MTLYKNSQGLKCPNCNSENYVFEGKEDKWECDDCENED
jgi:ribosomal protein L37AE/L43A